LLFVWRALFPALLALVAWLSLTPDEATTSAGFSLVRRLAAFLFGEARHSDKLAHFLAYGALGGAYILAEIRPLGARLWGLMGIVLYGLALEGAQEFVDGRQPDVFDALANSFGAFAGAASALFLVRLRRGRRPRMI